MEIKVKCGSSEIYYSQDTEANSYPHIVSKDKHTDGKTKGEFLMSQIKQMCEAVKAMEARG